MRKVTLQDPQAVSKQTRVCQKHLNSMEARQLGRRRDRDVAQDFGWNVMKVPRAGELRVAGGRGLQLHRVGTRRSVLRGGVCDHGYLLVWTERDTPTRAPWSLPERGATWRTGSGSGR